MNSEYARKVEILLRMIPLVTEEGVFAVYGGTAINLFYNVLHCRKKKRSFATRFYSYPKIDKELGLGVLLPTYEEIAQAIAKRDKARIVPAGAYAMNRLGLSTQVPMNVVYLTDGTPRKVLINGNRGILFKHVSPRNLAFQNQLALLINSALKEIGQENITEEDKSRIKALVLKEPKDSILQDLKLMPDWIASIIRGAYE
jgi:hypothetical protein